MPPQPPQMWWLQKTETHTKKKGGKRHLLYLAILIAPKNVTRPLISPHDISESTAGLQIPKPRAEIPTIFPQHPTPDGNANYIRPLVTNCDCLDDSTANSSRPTFTRCTIFRSDITGRTMNGGTREGLDDEESTVVVSKPHPRPTRPMRKLATVCNPNEWVRRKREGNRNKASFTLHRAADATDTLSALSSHLFALDGADHMAAPFTPAPVHDAASHAANARTLASRFSGWAGGSERGGDNVQVRAFIHGGENMVPGQTFVISNFGTCGSQSMGHELCRCELSKIR